MTILVDFDAEAIREAATRHGVARLSLFGSAVAEGFTEESDLDFLVDFLPQRDDIFEDFCGLKEELQAITHRDVDLVITRAMRNPLFKESALAQAESIYVADL
ncbi:MAG TPA: nucleotidyltransferase domain-containing protein [Candidatus Rothia avicola]|uniref:Nucleotidyltransferase domain-containing protein n=1 Tax=Candidatus Rothia avicola TaxID=2840478 RepID=A0A9D1ZSS1_9MICC|nr:nucleotidyltransferase domain-containing protein [Candidatus Rothia avicola]